MHSLRFGFLAIDLFEKKIINSLLCVAIVTELVNDTLQNIWLCAADCNQVCMNKTLFALNAFDHLILTFKVNMSPKIPEITENLKIFQLCFHGNNLRLWDITFTYC